MVNKNPFFNKKYTSFIFYKKISLKEYDCVVFVDALLQATKMAINWHSNVLLFKIYFAVKALPSTSSAYQNLLYVTKTNCTKYFGKKINFE